MGVGPAIRELIDELKGSSRDLFIKERAQWHRTNGWKRLSEHLQRCSVPDPILRKYFSHPSLVIYFFATSPIKPKLWEQIVGGLLIANHLDESLWYSNQKHWSVVRLYFITLFYMQVGSVVAETFTTRHRETTQLCWAKNIFLSQTSMFWLFLIQFYCAQLEMLSGKVETRRNLLVNLFLNYNATKSVLHRIPIFKQQVRRDSQAFASRLCQQLQRRMRRIPRAFGGGWTD